MINSVSIKLVHAALPGSDVLPGMVIRTAAAWSVLLSLASASIGPSEYLSLYIAGLTTIAISQKPERVQTS